MPVERRCRTGRAYAPGSLSLSRLDPTCVRPKRRADLLLHRTFLDRTCAHDRPGRTLQGLRSAAKRGERVEPASAGFTTAKATLSVSGTTMRGIRRLPFR